MDGNSRNGLSAVNKGRNTNLDLMKIIACVAVVGLHTLRAELSVMNAILYYLCGFAVPVFFMASGYILLNRRAADFRYSARKTAHVLRVIVCWAAIVFAENLAIDGMHHTVTAGTFLYFPKVMVKALLLQKGRLWHFWYFGALMLVYACLPLLCRFRRHLPKIWLVLAVSGGVVQAASYAFGMPLQAYVVQTFRLWTWLQYFMLGGLLGGRKPIGPLQRLSALPTGRHGLCLLAVTAVTAVYQMLAGRYLLHNPYAEYFYDSLLTVLWVTLLFTFVMKLRDAEGTEEAVRHVAPLTMGIYILHPLIIKEVSRFAAFDGVWLSLFDFVWILSLSYLAALVISKIPFVKKLIQL